MTIDQEGRQNSSETDEHYRRNQSSKGHVPYSLAATFFRGLGVRISTHIGPLRNDDQRISSYGFSSLKAFFTAISATASITHSKFSRPTEVTSASGAGFMKSIAYGTPSSTANSTVFKSYPRALQRVIASFSTRSFMAGAGTGFPFTYRS